MEDFERMTLMRQLRSRGQVTALHINPVEREEMQKTADRRCALDSLIACALMFFAAGVLFVLSVWCWKQGNVRAFQACLGGALIEFDTAALLVMDARKVILR